MSFHSGSGPLSSGDGHGLNVAGGAEGGRSRTREARRGSGQGHLAEGRVTRRKETRGEQAQGLEQETGSSNFKIIIKSMKIRLLSFGGVTNE